MTKAFSIDGKTSFNLAEEKASQYFEQLVERVRKQTYLPTLTKDIHIWKKDHKPSLFSIFSRGKEKTDFKNYHHYIKSLDYMGQLDDYLNRSISYIFMRDLGKDLSDEETERRITRTVSKLKIFLTKEQDHHTFTMAGLYRMTQKEGLETSFIDLMDKLKSIRSNIPKGMDAEEAQRKLIKLIAGVIMHELEEMDETVQPDERRGRLKKAIKLGYSYGLTYPFIDDLLDANILSDKEREMYTNLIRTTLITGVVPELGEWKGKNKKLMEYVHSELKTAFVFIKNHQKQETKEKFFEQSFVFFQSQEVDREKTLSYPHYSNEELYIPVIMKSAYSRLIARSIISAPDDEGFDDRTFYYGIYNQLADDFADMFEDLEGGRVTPYTYYLTYHEKRKDLINPFELYWAVISFLIHDVYQSNSKTREVILDRAVNGLKRFKSRIGDTKYSELMENIATFDKNFNTIIQQLVKKANNVEFFDKLLRDHIISNLKEGAKQQERFIQHIRNSRSYINKILPISSDQAKTSEPIVEAANYSLAGNGKRLRPIITLLIGDAYGLTKEKLSPLVKSLEYMHTASLVYDDLPSQDDSAIRRGRPTIHTVYNTAIAELTGLFLTQQAIEEQTFLHHFNPEVVLRLIRYSAKTTAEMCRGQAMDLQVRNRKTTVSALEELCYYKTGLAFEAALITPAILAKANESEINKLKRFAYHAGIAFQIKDDLLDSEGVLSSIGKPVGKDIDNQHSTFVTILGKNEAKKEMWEHYCMAIETTQDIPRNISFLKQIMNYLIHRDH